MIPKRDATWEVNVCDKQLVNISFCLSLSVSLKRHFFFFMAKLQVMKETIQVWYWFMLFPHVRGYSFKFCHLDLNYSVGLHLILLFVEFF